MAFDAFLKIQTIKGESNDSKFADWIQIESFSWGEERPSSGTGVAIPLELQLVTTVPRTPRAGAVRRSSR